MKAKQNKSVRVTLSKSEFCMLDAVLNEWIVYFRNDLISEQCQAYHAVCHSLVKHPEKAEALRAKLRRLFQ